MTITREGILKHKAVFDAWLDGAEVEEYYPGGLAHRRIGYHITDSPEFLEGDDLRIKATPDSIDWSHVAPEFKWMARGDGGVDTYIFNRKPSINVASSQWYSSDAACLVVIAQHFASYKQGTCDWTESLQERPNE